MGLRLFGPCLLMAAVLFSGTTAWAERVVQGQAADGSNESAAKVDHQPLFAVLDQWMLQNTASYNFDLRNLRDPFMPPSMGGCRVYASEPISPARMWLNPASMQLKLVAITMLKDGSTAIASFEDGAGNSYALRVGDRVGHTNGRVIKIDRSTVTVETPRRESCEPARITEIKLPASGLSANSTRSGEEL